jgi:hypothetical protein
MNYRHRELAKGKWDLLSLTEQMANIGSEVERTISWKAKGRMDLSGRAFERAIELLDLTNADAKNRFRLKELLRVREALADYFVFDNIYQSTSESWQRYFRCFLMAVRGKY